MIKKILLFGIPFIILTIFITSIVDTNYYFGGDLIFPLNPQNNIMKSIYMWDPENGGFSFFRYMYLVWQLFFYTISIFHIPSYIGIKMFITLLYVGGFIFTYLSYKLIFRNTKYDTDDLAITASLLFILNPIAALVLNGYYPLYCIPVCIFFLIKFFDTNKIYNLLFFSLFINLGYFSDLPQARNLLVLCVTFLFILPLYKYIRNISFGVLVKKLSIAAIVTVCINSFVLLPFLYDAFKPNGAATHFASNITVYDGNADLHSAALPYISRFFNLNIVDQSRIGSFLASRTFTIWTFFLQALALISVFFVSKKDKKIIYILLGGFVLFIFLAKGANPPFGEVYKYLLFNVPIFRIIRSSSNVIIGAVFFFSLLATLSLYSIKKLHTGFLYAIVLIHIIIFHPIYQGYKLYTPHGGDPTYKGIIIPHEYIQMGRRLDAIHEDTKILSLPIDDTYQYTDWKYSGTPLLLWLSQKPLIHAASGSKNSIPENERIRSFSQKEACAWTGMQNIGYIVHTKDSVDNYPISEFRVPTKKISSDNFLELHQVDTSCIQPHIYPAMHAIAYNGDVKNVPFILSNRENRQSVVFADAETNTHGISNEKVIEGKLTEEISDHTTHQNEIKFNPYNITYTMQVPTTDVYKFTADKTDIINWVKINNQPLDIHTGVISLKQGTYTVTISLKEQNNMIENAERFDSRESREGKEIFPPSIPYLPNVIEYNFNSWQHGELYFIQFSYNLTQFNPALFVIDEQRVERFGRVYRTSNINLVSKEIGRKQLVGDTKFLIRSNINAIGARLYFTNVNQDSMIDSIIVQKIIIPRIFLYNTGQTTIHTPKIAFQKINPTKYIVDIKGQEEPFVLNFSENFNPDWKLYVVPPDHILSTEKTFRTYYNGEVVENESRNDLFDPKGMDLVNALPEKQHLRTNGFSNGWYIKPSDAQQRKNYQLVIMYNPQRIFFLGAIISFLAFAITIIIAIKKRTFI